MRSSYATRNFVLMRTSDQPRPEVLSVTQVAHTLGLSPRTVLHRITAGKITATKLGPGTASYVITRDEVDRLLAEAEQAASA